MNKNNTEANHLIEKICVKAFAWVCSGVVIEIAGNSSMNLINSTLIKNQIALGQMTNSSTNFVLMEIWKAAIPIIIIIVSLLFLFSIIKDLMNYFNKEK